MKEFIFYVVILLIAIFVHYYKKHRAKRKVSVFDPCRRDGKVQRISAVHELSHQKPRKGEPGYSRTAFTNSCRCPERNRSITERRWVVSHHKHNHANGQETESIRSSVKCLSCHKEWRTSAKFIEKLPKEQAELFNMPPVLPTDTLGAGIVTGAGMNFLTDEKKTWLPGEFTKESNQVIIIAGNGVGQVRLIIKNTHDSLIVAAHWDVQPDETSKYIISAEGYKADPAAGDGQDQDIEAPADYSKIVRFVSGLKNVTKATIQNEFKLKDKEVDDIFDCLIKDRIVGTADGRGAWRKVLMSTDDQADQETGGVV